MTKFKYLVVILTFFSFTKIYALDSIKINDDTLSPVFDKKVYKYNYYTNKDKIKISVSKDNKESVTGYGYFNLNEGNNEFVVTSTIEDISYNYKINVYKDYKKDSDSVATFKSLNIENYDINFKNDIHEYTIDIKDEASLKINYELDSLSSIVEIKNNGNFIKSNNDVVINIKSKDGNNSNEYIVHVNKAIKVFKDESKTTPMSYLQKEILKITIIIISCSLVVLTYYLIFIKKVF